MKKKYRKKPWKVRCCDSFDKTVFDVWFKTEGEAMAYYQQAKGNLDYPDYPIYEP